MSQSEFLARLVVLLERHAVPFMVVGSLASAYHGTPRATHDADLVIDPTSDALEGLLESLVPKRYYVDADAARDALARRGQFNVIDLETGWKADLVIRKARSFSAAEFERRRSALIEGVRVDVASPEDTVIAKLEWASLGESERQLRDAAGILAVRGDELDFDYLSRWVNELGVEHLWHRLVEPDD